MDRLFFPYPEHRVIPLRDLADALIEVLARHFPIYGKMDVRCGQEDQSIAYRNAYEARELLSHCEEVHIISIKDSHFAMLIDASKTGFELDFVALSPDQSIIREIEALCVRIFAQV